MSTGVSSFQPVESLSSEYLAQVFLIKSLIARMATVTLVQVVKVTNTGGVAAVGFVDLQPLVSQVDPNMNPTDHAVIRNNPYFRIQGGKNAIIIDPEVGDVGIALFASRDISAVSSTLTGGRAATKQDPISPGSFRKYDMADALYMGGVLNGVPTQFIQFAAGGITITSPHPVTINGTDVNVNASAACNVTSTGKTIVTASEIDLVGGGGTAGGAVQKDCVCAFTGVPHPMFSATVKATP
jgi:hypothetical protein